MAVCVGHVCGLRALATCCWPRRQEARGIPRGDLTVGSGGGGTVSGVPPENVPTPTAPTPTVPSPAGPAAPTAMPVLLRGSLLTWPAWRLVLLVVVAVQVTALAGTVLAKLGHLTVLLLVCMVLACALEPAVDALAARRMNRRAAALLVVVGLLGLFVALVAAVGTAVSGQVSSLSAQLPTLAQQVATAANEHGLSLDAASVMAKVEQARDAAGHALSDNAAEAASSATAGLVDLVTSLFVIYYLVADGPKLRRAICSVLPAHRQRHVLTGWEIALDKAGGYLVSRAGLAVCSVIASSVAFFAFGLPYALALGLWMGVISQTVPVLGTYLAASLPVLVALTVSPARALWVVVFLVVWQQIENFAIQPWLTRKTLEVHPALCLIAVFAGTALLGAAGALIALPVLATVQAVLDTYLHRHELVDDALLGGTDEPSPPADPDPRPGPDQDPDQDPDPAHLPDPGSGPGAGERPLAKPAAPPTVVDPATSRTPPESRPTTARNRS